ncbi:formate dehydrogenase [Rhodosalinus halophilus]|uniref:Formate dehydrogenase n=1 Tax=Rhodosalinus halophilus TaxID=2259333 RepID=A0A365U8R8_9RHOB|nr:formate dehydrogenase subunit delta [Rhodosalinus halophilus]RBI85145.1 formate dehydrogenase [Rhodosalinus halophilus]
MSPEKLARMANQIATFFRAQPAEDRAALVAKHLNDFWEPRMRRQLLDLVQAGHADLDPLVVEAAGRMRAPA